MSSEYDKSIGAVLDLPNGQRVTGYVTLDGEGAYGSRMKIFSDESFTIPSQSSVHGVSELGARGKLSLLDCYGGPEWDDELPEVIARRLSMRVSCDLQSQFAVFGHSHLRLDDRVIRSVRFTFEDINNVVFNRGTRGAIERITSPHSSIVDAVEEHKPVSALSPSRKGLLWLVYPTDKRELLPKTETVLGTISVRHGMRTTQGFHNITDIPYINIDFDDEIATLQEVVGKIRTVRQFLSWMIGYPLRWKKVRVFTGKLNGNGQRILDNGKPDIGLDVFMPVDGGTKANGSSAFAVLIRATQNPDHFAHVMNRWMKRNTDEKVGAANSMFFASMMLMRFSENKICTAANAFDLLGASQKLMMPQQVTDIVAEARQKVDCLGPDVLDRRHREIVRSRLGYIHAPSLRDLVEHRAGIIAARVGDDTLPRLKEMVAAAVECRNHFTHGKQDRTRADYADLEVIVSLTDTLHFIYGVSELLECDWDIDTWIKGDMTQYHPFGRFLTSYGSLHVRRVLGST